VSSRSGLSFDLEFVRILVMLDTHALANSTLAATVYRAPLPAPMTNTIIRLANRGLVAAVKRTSLTSAVLEAAVLAGRVDRSHTSLNYAALTAAVGSAVVALINSSRVAIRDQTSSPTSMFHTQVGRTAGQLSAMAPATPSVACAKIS
jgi:hypothetical protein